jgi:hypothetical protein
MPVSELDFRNHGGLDMEAVLTEMHELDETAGDWKEHLPYDAAVSYFVDDAVRRQFEAHVEACAFCQEMLDTLNPSDRTIDALHQAAIETYLDEVAVTAKAPSDDGWLKPVWPIAASIVVGLGLIGYMMTSEEITPALIREAPIQVVMNSERPSLPEALDRIATLERSPKIEDQFLAARLYFDSGLDQLGFRRIGDGLAYAGADPLLVQAVAEINDNRALDAEQLIQIRNRFEAMSRMNLVEPSDYVQTIELSAALGERAAALQAIEGYLRINESTQPVAGVFDQIVITRENLDATQNRK